jgi:hypothetical protein
LDTSGNVGIGVTPSAWSAGGFVQLPNSRAFAFAGAAGDYISNGYYDGSWKYTTTAAVSRYRQDAGSHQWFTAPSGTAGNAITFTQAMTLDASGNLGIGVTPSVSKLHVGITSTATSGLAEANALKIENNNATVNNAAGLFLSQTGDAGCGIAGIATSRTGGSRTSALALYYYNQATSASPIEGARLDASGNLLIGQTASTNGNLLTGYAFNYNSGASQFFIGHQTGTASGTTYEGYSYNGTLIGSITQNGTTGVLYNITSDYRLKEQVQPLVGGLARVNALKPSVYKWKSDGSNGEGFLAHELAEVVPFAVSGEKDAVNEDGSIKSQGIDMSRVVPILVAAIQELTARVQTLETR